MSQDALTKAERYTRISHLLCNNPGGLTTTELARHCGVAQRTIQRDLRALDDLHIPLWEEDTPDGEHRYGLAEGYYVPPVRLSADDALALFLAGRLLSQYNDNYNPHIRDALAKLSHVLPSAMQQHIQRMGDQMQRAPGDASLASILSTLGRGWAMRRQVRIGYWAAGRDEHRLHIVHPYFLEPSAVNSGTYLIGHDVDADALRTFKVERIADARLLPQGFELPDGFDPAALLESCWGIMYGSERQTVRLRFAPQVARRVRETCWHPTQQLADCTDGGCELTLQIANPVEITYWVRGWGPSVTVLEPTWLREQLAAEARQTADLYAEA